MQACVESLTVLPWGVHVSGVVLLLWGIGGEYRRNVGLEGFPLSRELSCYNQSIRGIDRLSGGQSDRPGDGQYILRIYRLSGGQLDRPGDGQSSLRLGILSGGQ